MRIASVPFLLVSILGLAACSKGDKGAGKPSDKPAEKAAAATCATATDHIVAMMLSSDKMKSAPPDERKAAEKTFNDLKGEMVKKCEEDKIPQADLDCAMAAKTEEELAKCDHSGAKGGAAEPGGVAAAPAAAPAAGAPTLDSFAAGLASDKVVQALGEPSHKGDVMEQAADGTFVAEWRYDDKGLVLGLGGGSKKGPFAAQSITCEKSCTLKTEKGVGLGATADEVKKAYGEKINKQDSTDEQLIVGERLGGTFFHIKDGKVDSIYIGAGGE